MGLYNSVLQGWYRKSCVSKRKKWHKVISKPTAWNTTFFELACGIARLSQKEFDDIDWKRSPCGTTTCKNCERLL